MAFTFHDGGGGDHKHVWESLSPKGGPHQPSLLGQRGDDVMLPEQRVLLVLQLDLGAAVLGQEHRVANLEEAIGMQCLSDICERPLENLRALPLTVSLPLQYLTAVIPLYCYTAVM